MNKSRKQKLENRNPQPGRPDNLRVSRFGFISVFSFQLSVLP